MSKKLEDLLDFFESNLSENNFNQLKKLRNPQNSIDPEE